MPPAPRASTLRAFRACLRTTRRRSTRRQQGMRRHWTRLPTASGSTRTVTSIDTLLHSTLASTKLFGSLNPLMQVLGSSHPEIHLNPNHIHAWASRHAASASSCTAASLTAHECPIHPALSSHVLSCRVLLCRGCGTYASLLQTSGLVLLCPLIG